MPPESASVVAVAVDTHRFPLTFLLHSRKHLFLMSALIKTQILPHTNFLSSIFFRVHFGMNGSMRINPAERRDRTGSTPVLEIHLTNDIVCFFDSTAEGR